MFFKAQCYGPTSLSYVCSRAICAGNAVHYTCMAFLVGGRGP